MKKYNRLIFCSLLIYFLLSGGVFYAVEGMVQEQAKEYKVEINRLTAQIRELGYFQKPDLDIYEYVEDMQFLPADIQDEQTLTTFYNEEPRAKMFVYPWYDKDGLKGYLKFVYHEKSFDSKQLLLLAEGSLLLMELLLLGILLYLKVKLIQPFQNLQQLPQELAHGHFRGEIKEEKSRFLGKFLWGMSQLKDALDISRKRQMELEKEKKELLLSLSHDIKTPLNLIQLYGKAIEEQVYQTEEERVHAAHQIQNKTQEIERYVEEIMKTSREDILDLHMEIKDFYLQDLMDKILPVFQETCAIHLLDMHVAPYENRLLHGDINRVQEVFENLFDNAMKYGDGKRIEITFYEEDFCQLIRFYNSGESISDHDSNHVFESFFRGANAQGKQGSGLGLYICRQIMRAMDGEIFVQKEEDGMSFILVFR